MDPLKTAPTQENKLHFLDYWRIIRIRKTVILAVFLLVVITATLVTYVLPKHYESKASIKVDRASADIAEMSGRSMSGIYDPYFIQTEFEAIRSEAVLTNVVNRLDLNKRWGDDYAGGQRLPLAKSLEILRSHLDLRPVRNTMFIEIGVVMGKPGDAAELANAIAEAYRDHRLAEIQRQLEGGIRVLEQRFKDHQSEIKKVSDEVADLRDQFQVSDPSGPSALEPMSTLDYNTVSLLSGQLAQEQSAVDREVKKLDTLNGMSPEDRLLAIPSVEPDPQLNELNSQLNLAKQSLIKTAKDFGTNNPAYQSAVQLVDHLTIEVSNRVVGVMNGLKTRVLAQQQGVASLSNRLASAKSTDIARAKVTRPYWEKKRELDQLQTFQKFLDNRIQMETVDKTLPRSAMVTIMTPARPEDKPISPKVTLNIILGVIVGLVVGVGLAFFIEYLDTSVKTIDDVERALQAPVLGVIPQNVGLLMKEGAESPHAEAYRVLRTNILFSRKDEKLNCMAVVSAGAGEGKSTTVFNLATIFAQSGSRVVVVDSDLRRPTLHKMLSVTNSIGLTNYLLKQNTLEEVIQTTPIPTLDFMASGKLPSSSLGILSSSQMKDLINELKNRYDFVFFDSPPIMGVSDASILASEVAMTIQVIQYRRYPQPMNIRAKQMIEKVGGNLIGIVLNNINMSQDESYYYYSGYYHDYYYTRSEDSDDKGAPPQGGGGDQAKVEIKQKY
ncbi:MAG: Tyrosine-protein kinase YwqD [Verrucomicrobiota bacterium]|jgi:capsular exopolysaccharide synthesis family protein